MLRKGLAHRKHTAGWITCQPLGIAHRWCSGHCPREHRPLHIQGFCSSNCHLYRPLYHYKWLNLNLNLISQQCLRCLHENSLYSQKAVSHMPRNTITRQQKLSNIFKNQECPRPQCNKREPRQGTAVSRSWGNRVESSGRPSGWSVQGGIQRTREGEPRISVGDSLWGFCQVLTADACEETTQEKGRNHWKEQFPKLPQGWEDFRIS